MVMILLVWICSIQLGNPNLHRWIKSWPMGYAHLNMAGYEIKRVALDFFRTFSTSSCIFPWRVALFFRPEVDNPSSNSIGGKTKFKSIKRYQTWSMLVLYVSVNTTLCRKTTTISNSLKVCNSSMKNQYPWNHSVDKRHYFLCVKFEIKFVISFTGKSVSNKKCRFSWRGSILFRKAAFETFGNFWFSELKGTHGACVDSIQKAKWSSRTVRLVHPYTWHKVKSLLYA